MSQKTEQKTLVASVAKVVSKYELVINRGSQQGVEIGNRFLVYGIGDEIIDPETKESLGHLEIVRGIGKVIHVQTNMATLRTARTRNPPPTVKKITRPGKNSLRALMYGIEGEEVIEERQGEPEEVPFEDVSEGDKAKPI